MNSKYYNLCVLDATCYTLISILPLCSNTTTAYGHPNKDYTCQSHLQLRVIVRPSFVQWNFSKNHLCYFLIMSVKVILTCLFNAFHILLARSGDNYGSHFHPKIQQRKCVCVCVCVFVCMCVLGCMSLANKIHHICGKKHSRSSLKVETIFSLTFIPTQQNKNLQKSRTQN